MAAPRSSRIEDILRAQLETAKKRYRHSSIDFDDFVTSGSGATEQIGQIDKAERERKIAAQELAIALGRFNDFILRGTIPPDLAEKDGAQAGPAPSQDANIAKGHAG
jgi:outer membrane protein TolC